MADFTPEQIARLDAAESAQKAAELSEQARSSVFHTLSPEELAQLSIDSKGEFDPVSEFRRLPDLAADRAIVDKAIKANALLEQRGFRIQDMPGIVDSAKTAAKMVFDVGVVTPLKLIKGAGHTSHGAMEGLAAKITGKPEIQAEADKATQKGQREIFEVGAAMEKGGVDVEQMAEKVVRNPAESLIRKGVNAILGPVAAPLVGEAATGKVLNFFGVGPSDKDQESRFWRKVGQAQTREEAATGKGPAMETIGGEVRKELVGANLPPRAEEMERSDPLSWWAFGKAFGKAGQATSAATKTVGEMIPAGVKSAAAKAGAIAYDAPATMLGRAIERFGNISELGSKAAQISGGMAPWIGAAAGATQGPLGILGGLAGGELISRRLTSAGTKALAGAKAITEVGKQIGGKAPAASPVAQLGIDAASAIPTTATEMAKGAAMDVVTAAATSETPAETQSQPFFGVAFGALGGVRHAGSKMLSGQLVAQRPGAEKVVGYSPLSDAPEGVESAHKAAVLDAPPLVQAWVNAVRRFAKSATQTDVFYVPDDTQRAQALTDLGYAGDIPTAVGQNAVFFKNSDGKKVAILKEADAAPHESGHGLQDVLGQEGNAAVDALIKSEYAGNWEVEGARQAFRILLGSGFSPEQAEQFARQDWRSVVLHLTGAGRLFLADRVYKETYDRLKAETGTEPAPEEVQRFADAYLHETAVKKGTLWNDYLSPEEAKDAADTYLAREIGAENFDALFKHTGASLREAPGVLPKLATGVAKLVSALGGNPLEGRVSETGDVPLSMNVIEAMRGAGQEASPKLKTAPSLTRGRTTHPVDEVNAVLAENPTGIEDRDNAARTLAEARDSGQGVQVSYWAAKGEPAGDPSALRPERRQQIESQRDAANSDRVLVTKHLFPFKQVKTGKGLQWIGWSPNNFNANAAKLKTWISALTPEMRAKLNLPYDITTAEGEAQLQRDLQVFTENQLAGFTGSGRDLVLPADVEAAGFTKPKVQGLAIPLPQERADVINYLFNSQLPKPSKTGIIQPRTGEFPLNLAGQKIATATAPEAGRVTEPVVPRGEYGGPRAEAMGVAGERVQEVNPFRANVEAVAQAAKVPPPSLIEATQRLNLERLADAVIAPEVPKIGANTLTLQAGFQPRRLNAKQAEEKLGLRSAAVRLQSGRVVEGATHDAALAKAQANQWDVSGSELGFTTDNGSFVDRGEGRRIAEGAEQLDQSRTMGSGLSLDSWDFNNARRFQPPAVDRDKVRGGKASRPLPTYNQDTAPKTQEGNPWVRQSDAPTNEGRQLLVQFSSDLLNAAGKADEASQYYDKLYSGTRKGYERLPDSWEIPQWIGFASKFLPNADVYVVRDMSEAKKFLKESGYDRVAFSALDTNAKLIKELAQDYGRPVDVGGYTANNTFSDTPNVKWHNSMEEFAKDVGVPHESGVDYRHFSGAQVIPRLTMSQGCQHKCAFCTVEKTLTTTPDQVVMQQAEEIGKLGAKLVYLNDKTFGQAKNYESLVEVNNRIKEINPDFKGFVIQTTAAQMRKLSPEFLKNSGIRFIELGIETYNDPILREMRKPASEKLMDAAVAKLRESKVALIPNIIIGLPGETTETYQRTLDFLKRNSDIISHANIYNLAVYKDAELGKKLTTATEDDFNENVLQKSFHADPAVHRVFAGDVYGLGNELLGAQPDVVQYQAKALPEGVTRLKDATELWPRTSATPQFQPPQDPTKRHVASAAIRMEGKIYPGVFHADALMTAMSERSMDRETPAFDSGFLDNEGKWLTREEAFTLSRDAGQVKEGSSAYTIGVTGKAYAPEGTVPEGKREGRLESVTFDASRQFQAPSAEELTKKFSDEKGWDEALDPKFKSERFGGGMTARAHELGSSIKDVESLKVLAGMAKSVAEGRVAKMKSGDYDGAFRDGAKGQFIRETIEAAIGGTSADYIRKNYDPNYVPPMAGAQFQPKTETGKRFAENGFEFIAGGSRGFRHVAIHRDGSVLGEIVSHQKSPDVAYVDLVHVAEPAQGLGLGEALYRELFTQLKEDGVKQVTSMAVHPATVKLHKKMDPFTTYTLGDTPATFDEAVKAASDVVNEDGFTIAPEPVSRITEDSQFQPPEKLTKEQEDAIPRFTWDELLGFSHTRAGDQGFLEWVFTPGVSWLADFPGSRQAVANALDKVYDNAHGGVGGEQNAWEAVLAPWMALYTKSVNEIDASRKTGELHPLPLPQSSKDMAFEKSATPGKFGRLIRLLTSPEAPRISVEPPSDLSKVEEGHVNWTELARGLEDDLPAGMLTRFGGVKAIREAAQALQLGGSPKGPSADLLRAIGSERLKQRGMRSEGGIRSDLLGGEYRMESEAMSQDLAKSYPFRGEEPAPDSVDTTKRIRELERELRSLRGEGKFQPTMAELEAKWARARAAKGKAPMTRLSDDSWKLKKGGDDLISKAWINSLGTPIQLGAKWHHQYLYENQKETGIKVPPFEGSDVSDAREAALNRGWVRVNYAGGTGDLTFELLKSELPERRRAIREFVEANSQGLTHITVSLFNRKGGQIDSDRERVFDIDADERVNHIPFVTSGQYQPVGFQRDKFDSEITNLRSGKSSGQTFNNDGSVWTAPKKPVDLVSLSSVNLPLEDVTPEAVFRTLGTFSSLLDDPRVALGVFKFDKDGVPTVSIDLNAIVPQKYRENTTAFAKANDQVSIWDAAKSEEVKTGGSGDTRITNLGSVKTALDAITTGKPVDVEQLSGKTARAQTGTLPGFEGLREYDASRLEGMTRDELKAEFPEALVPNKSGGKEAEVPSDILNSPLAKQAGSREEAVKLFASKMVDDAKRWKDRPEWKSGSRWYSEFTPMLNKHFGEWAPRMAELLAATSPNTDPLVNFAYAYDALRSWQEGRFDKIITKFGEGLKKLEDGSLKPWWEKQVALGKIPDPPQGPSDATYLAGWVHVNDLKPKQTNGKLYGQHSANILSVFVGQWLGSSGPKTQNFYKNLIGTGHEATIDLWADRTLRRLGYSGFQDRWRVLPRNKAAVTDADFQFAQEVFREAARRMKMKADDLQGAMWFAEKALWAENGWGSLDLGDYREELKKAPYLESGFQKRLKEGKKRVKEEEQLDLITPR